MFPVGPQSLEWMLSQSCSLFEGQKKKIKKKKFGFLKMFSNKRTTGMANEYFGLIRLLIISVMTLKIILSSNFSKSSFQHKP
jgi:hypothetical protein